MINYIWLGLIVIGIVVGGLTGRMDEMTKALLDSVKTAVELSIGLIGIMALWLGLMKLAEGAGLLYAVARGLKPIMKRLFPDVPDGHPAMGSMVANISANLLGLGNSATALGLKAMQDLQTLNKTEDTATNAMVTFLTINTTSITLIPATVIAMRVSAGSTDPTSIIVPTIIASTFATIVGVASAKWLEKLRVYRLPKAAEE